jgi:hypothetical protein
MTDFFQRDTFRRHWIGAAAGAVLILAGCASVPTLLSPVGPDPSEHGASDPKGHLQIFSVVEPQSEGDDAVWYQHSSYVIYNEQGKRFKYVGNTTGKWDKTPQTVLLPAGRYTVTARAEGYRYVLVNVPIVIEPGKTTVVHLEQGWNPPPGSGAEIVCASSGYAVGWRAGSSAPSSEQ